MCEIDERDGAVVLVDEGEKESKSRGERGFTVLIGPGEARWVDPTFPGTILLRY
jgi:hypothetical protein